MKKKAKTIISIRSIFKIFLLVSSVISILILRFLVYPDITDGKEGSQPHPNQLHADELNHAVIPEKKWDEATRYDLVCNRKNESQILDDEVIAIQKVLCDNQFVSLATKLLEDSTDDNPIHIIQIGAHIGFEGNDPLHQLLASFLRTFPLEQRKRLHWTFVEPSPYNYQKLVETLHKPQQSDLCTLKSIETAVLPDDTDDEKIDGLPFYSIQYIDPETGYDSKSGMTFPAWITQVSGFKIEAIKHNSGIWKKKGLNYKDYVKEIHVASKRFSELVSEVVHNKLGVQKQNNNRPLLILMDTEGYDCAILSGLSNEHASMMPHFFIYEIKNCVVDSLQSGLTNLDKLGYRQFIYRVNGVSKLK